MVGVFFPFLPADGGGQLNCLRTPCSDSGSRWPDGREEGARGQSNILASAAVVDTSGRNSPCPPPWLLLLARGRLLLLGLGRLLLLRRLLPPARVLVVVHPDLEDLAADADLVAEVLHQGLVLLLHPPPQALRERQHLLLLLGRELGPEPLPAQLVARPRGGGGGGVGGRRAALLAGGLGGGAAAAAGRAVVRERRVVEVVRGVVGVGRRQEQRDARCRRGRRWSGGRREQEMAPLGVVLAVEAAVAPAGGAPERVVPGGHELAAAVDDVAAERRGVVAQALVVPGLGGRRGVVARREGGGRRRGGRAHALLLDGVVLLVLVLAPKFHQRMPGCLLLLGARRTEPGRGERASP
ncbi:hypothetical protein U9M48_044979 [Paspalum notatum var. saurae]|uniref:Uncharacterized protein n=1 Tax=Paspalum notatum var. saurae TaxID=547442 RepID=A0AAQ3XI23_PASNO